MSRGPPLEFSTERAVRLFSYITPPRPGREIGTSVRVGLPEKKKGQGDDDCAGSDHGTRADEPGEPVQGYGVRVRLKLLPRERLDLTARSSEREPSEHAEHNAEGADHSNRPSDLASSAHRWTLPNGAWSSLVLSTAVVMTQCDPAEVTPRDRHLGAVVYSSACDQVRHSSSFTTIVRANRSCTP